jgi:stringent starvation protein B
MIDSKETASTRPYLIRALYEWCTDNGYTPFIAVQVDDTVRVPMEFVKDGEIVLNVSFEATSSLSLGNEYVEFKGRFGGVARDIVVPVTNVLAIYARENGQGMAFPMLSSLAASDAFKTGVAPSKRLVDTLKTVSDGDKPPSTKSPGGSRPSLTRVK